MEKHMAIIRDRIKSSICWGIVQEIGREREKHLGAMTPQFDTHKSAECRNVLRWCRNAMNIYSYIYIHSESFG